MPMQRRCSSSIRVDAAVAPTRSSREGGAPSHEIAFEIAGRRQDGRMTQVRPELVDSEGYAALSARGIAVVVKRMVGLGICAAGAWSQLAGGDCGCRSLHGAVEGVRGGLEVRSTCTIEAMPWDVVAGLRVVHPQGGGVCDPPIARERPDAGGQGAGAVGAVGAVGADESSELGVEAWRSASQGDQPRIVRVLQQDRPHPCLPGLAERFPLTGGRVRRQRRLHRRPQVGGPGRHG